MSFTTTLLRTLSFAIMLYCGIATSAEASLFLAFSASGSANTFNVNPNGNLSVPIYLRQESVDASHPNFVTTNGLNVFGVKGNLVGSGVSFVDNSLTFGSPFADQGILNPSSSTPSSFVMNGFDPRSGSPGVTGESILLGSITIHGNSPGALATLTLGDPDTNLDDFATSPNFGSFDAKVFASPASVTIAVVPEASCFVLAAIALSSVALTWRRPK